MEFRPDSLLDFLVWMQRGYEDSKFSLAEIKVIGIRAVDYMEFVDTEEEKRFNEDV